MTISRYLARLRSKVGTELLLLPAVALRIRDESGRLRLVQDRDSGAWGLPAGSVEPSESPSEAARRELLEGTGKFMRHVKLRPDDDLDPAALRDLIRAAYEDMKQRLGGTLPRP